MRKTGIPDPWSLILILLGLLGTSVWEMSARSSDGDRGAAMRRKARYYYTEGSRRAAEGSHAEAIEFFKYAHLLDPTYPEAAFSYGQERLVIGWDTLQSEAEVERSLSLMKPFVEQYPKDYEESTYYAYVASRTGHLDEATRVLERTTALMPERTAALLSLADLYLAQKQDSLAFATIDRYEKIEGASPQLTLKKISFMLNRRDTVGALRETSGLVKSNPREGAYMILKANIFKLIGERDSVLAYYHMAEETSPDYGAAKIALADFYREEGDSVNYDAKIYEALLADDYGLDDKVALLAEYLQKLIYDKSDTSRGDHLFKVLEEQYPHEPDVLDLDSRYTAAKGDFASAVEKVSYAIDLRQNSEELWLQKISYQIGDDKAGDAVRTYEKALTVIEPSYRLHMTGAAAAQIAEDYPTAIDIYGRVMKMMAPRVEPDSVLDLRVLPQTLSLAGYEQLSELYTSVGDCLYNMKKTDRAYIAYENALQLNPDNGMALNNYAYFMSEKGGDLAKAEDMSRRSLQGENERNPTFLDTYAWILHKLGRNEEAETFQRQAIEETGADKEASEELWDHLGDILMANGKTEEAVEAWKKAVENSKNPSKIQTKINNAK